jgi:hypothetical protein
MRFVLAVAVALCGWGLLPVATAACPRCGRPRCGRRCYRHTVAIAVVIAIAVRTYMPTFTLFRFLSDSLERLRVFIDSLVKPTGFEAFLLEPIDVPDAPAEFHGWGVFWVES